MIIVQTGLSAYVFLTLARLKLDSAGLYEEGVEDLEEDNLDDDEEDFLDDYDPVFDEGGLDDGGLDEEDMQYSERLQQLQVPANMQ